MEGVTVRLLPYLVADGAQQMAADEVMLLSTAAHRQASLRFYGWSPATLSLGYFQPAKVRHTDARLSGLAWVRRSTGGATLVHDREVTYALALPPGQPWQTGESWMLRMHRIIAAALVDLGVCGPIALAEHALLRGEVLCFEKHTPGDLVIAGAKVVGSAQRKHRQGLLQHGGILLAQSPATPRLPGLRELTGAVLTAESLQRAIMAQLTRATGWTLTADRWTTDEMQQIASIAKEKYRAAAWNEKR